MKRKEYTLYSEKVECDKNIAIVADMHIENINKYKINKVIDILNDIKPSHIVIPGDLCNKDSSVASKFINSICRISNVFFVRGNSDTKMLYEFDNTRLFVLNNYYNFISIDGIDFFGIKLSKEFYKLDEREKVLELIAEYKSLLEKLSNYIKNDRYKILLCHDPIIVDAIKVLNSSIFNSGINFDLIISGHNHGGTVPNNLKPLLKLLKYNIYNLYPKYTKGIINYENDSYMIVSEGVTKYNSFLENFHTGTVENVRVLKK